LAVYIISKQKIVVSSFLVYFGLFTVFCLCSCMWAKNQSVAISKTFTIVQIFALVFLLYNYLEREKRFVFFLNVMCISGTIFAVYTIMYFGIEEYLSGMEEGLRIGSEINNVNAIGMMTAITSLLNLWQFFYRRKKLNFLMALMCIVVSLGSGSRTAIIGLLFGIVLLLVLKGNSYKKIISIFLCVIILIVFYYILSLPAFSFFMDRMESMVDAITGKSNDIDNSSRLRLKMIEVGLIEFSNRPILGIGIGNSTVITAQYFNETETYLHNNYVELLATTGIVGTFLFYAMFFIPFLKLIKPSLKQDAFAIICFVIIAVNLVFHIGSVDYYNKVSFLYLIISWLCLSNMKKEKVTK